MKASRVLVADGSAGVRRNLGLMLEGGGHSVLEAADGIDAVALANRHRPDLVIVDVALPGLDGISVCRRLKADRETAALPVVVTGDRAERSTVIGAARAGADDFVIKAGISAAGFVERIARLIAAAGPASDGATRGNGGSGGNAGSGGVAAAARTGREAAADSASPAAATERRIDRVAEAKALPFLASEILSTAADGGSSARDLAELVERDQAITAKLLKLANSSMYAGAGRTTTVGQAVSKLGFNGVREMILGMCLIESYGASDGGGLDRIAFWRHSLAVAALAETLVAGPDRELGQRAFVAGLLHDIGKAVADDVLPELYREVLRRVRDEGERLLDAESDVLGIDHVAIGSRVGRKWRLPQDVLGAIAHHHKDAATISGLPSRLSPRLVGAVRLADLLARAVGHGSSGEDVLERIGPEEWKSLGLTASDVREALGGVRERLKGLEELLMLYQDPDRSGPDGPTAAGESLLLLAGNAEIDPVEVMLVAAGYEVTRSTAVPADLAGDPPGAVVFEKEAMPLAAEVVEALSGTDGATRLVAVGVETGACAAADGLRAVAAPVRRGEVIEALGLNAGM